MAATIWRNWLTSASTTTYGVTIDSGTNSCMNNWVLWNSVSTSATCTATSHAWTVWNTAHVVAEETREAREAREARNAQLQAENAERIAREKQERESAAKRALILLMSVLNRRQQKQYQESKAFTMLSADRKRRYRIKHGWAGNVELLDTRGRVKQKYCIHPRETVPIEDNLVAQRLMLLRNEQEFLRVANRVYA